MNGELHEHRYDQESTFGVYACACGRRSTEREFWLNPHGDVVNLDYFNDVEIGVLWELRRFRVTGLWDEPVTDTTVSALLREFT